MGGSETAANWAAWANRHFPGDEAAQQEAIRAAAAAAARGADAAAATSAGLAAGRSFQSYSHAITPAAPPPVATGLTPPPTFPGAAPPPPFPEPARMAMPVGCTRSFLRNPTAMVAAGGGLIGLSALGIIVVLIVGGNPITRTATQASTRQPVSAPAGQEVDGALARRVAIDTSSLSPGWRLADEGFSSPEDLAQHRCASTAFATPTSNFYRAFQYNVTAHGYSGDLYVAVSTAATAADSDRSWAVITSDQYLPCLTSWSQEGLTGPDTSPTGKTIVRRVGPAPDVAAPSIVYELQTPYRLHGENKVMHETDVHVAQGRVTAHMIVGRCCSEAEDEGWKTMIRQLSVTLAHNLEGNTGT